MAVVHLVAGSPSSPLSRLVDDYLVHVRARGLSPSTDTAYSHALRTILLPWCADDGIERVEQLDGRTLDRLSTDLLTRLSTRGKPLSPDSVHTYTRGIRQFLTWAQREGEPVTAKPQLPKLGKHQRDVLSVDEVNRLETAVPTERDKLIIRILSDCGLREGELVRLRRQDVLRPENRGQFHVLGKGRRERRVPVLPRLLRRIERYMDGGPPSQSDHIFVGLRRGRSGDYEPLEESGVRQLIRNAGLRARLGRPVNPHLLRHTWITEMLRQGMEPIHLSIIAGCSLKVIQDHYEHLNQDDAYESMLKALTSRDSCR
jgi:integrase/recombinase XerD